MISFHILQKTVVKLNHIRLGLTRLGQSITNETARVVIEVFVHLSFFVHDCDFVVKQKDGLSLVFYL